MGDYSSANFPRTVVITGVGFLPSCPASQGNLGSLLLDAGNSRVDGGWLAVIQQDSSS